MVIYIKIIECHWIYPRIKSLLILTPVTHPSQPIHTGLPSVPLITTWHSLDFHLTPLHGVKHDSVVNKHGCTMCGEWTLAETKSCLIIPDHTWSHLIIPDHTWSYLITPDHTWPCVWFICNQENCIWNHIRQTTMDCENYHIILNPPNPSSCTWYGWQVNSPTHWYEARCIPLTMLAVIVTLIYGS